MPASSSARLPEQLVRRLLQALAFFRDPTPESHRASVGVQFVDGGLRAWAQTGAAAARWIVPIAPGDGAVGDETTAYVSGAGVAQAAKWIGRAKKDASVLVAGVIDGALVLRSGEDELVLGKGPSLYGAEPKKLFDLALASLTTHAEPRRLPPLDPAWIAAIGEAFVTAHHGADGGVFWQATGGALDPVRVTSSACALEVVVMPVRT